MIGRAGLVWLGLLAVAVGNGALRQGVLVPRMGETVGRALSSVTLSAAILVMAWLTIGWLAPRSAEGAWRIGGLWLALTLAFELLAGHYLFGTPWSTLLADYDLRRGRIWVLVLITTAVAPLVAARLRGIV